MGERTNGDKAIDVFHAITNNGLVVSIISGAITLVILLILGSYTYTWSESGRQEEEKVKWRDSHEKALDTRFAEVKDGQKQLTDAVNKNNDKMTEILLQILAEQKKSNEVSKRRNQ